MLTAKQFAAATGISYPVVVKWLRDGKIPAERVVNIWQISAEMVGEFKHQKPKRGRPLKEGK